MKSENIDYLFNEGFIPLIDYETKFNDKLLIWFPSSKYRKNNIIATPYENHIIYFEITNVNVNPLTGYRTPDLKEIKYKNN